MESEHILDRRLYDSIRELVVLDEAEMEHIGTCETCQQVMRVFVRRELARHAGS